MQVEQLARAALLAGPTPEAGLLLGEALHELGAFDEAEQVLSEAERTAPTDDALYTFVAEMRALNLMWGLRRHDDALAVNRAAQVHGTDPTASQELTLWEATLLTYSGRPIDALAVLESVDEADTPRARALRAVAEVSALAATGRPETAAAQARVAFAEHVQMPVQVAIANAGIHVINEIHALIEAGALRHAHSYAAGGVRSHSTERAAGRIHVALVPPRPQRTASRRGRDRAPLARRSRRPLPRSTTCSDRAGLRSRCSRPLTRGWAMRPAAAAAVAELDREPEFAFARAEQEFGRAWALVAAGDVPGGRRVLREAAELAGDTGYRVTEAWLLHDIARLGEPAAVADRLEVLAAECEGDLVAAYAAHARAATGERPEPLARGRRRLRGDRRLAPRRGGRDAKPRKRAQRQNDRRAASAASMRVESLLEACEGARTPALATTDSLVPLSAREREIATFAAHGDTATEIAARLFLSKRTVNNHLQNVYTKLGISGRAELAAALGETAPVTSVDPALPPS